MNQHPMWWTQHPCSHLAPPDAVAAAEAVNGEMIEKEQMFEKTLTPSDVGKLNRLVIPKQHAERYFPLGGGSAYNSGVESGLLLSFEDESGKCWKFRYSYWNSSQSYVLTKGWSRYVKEKGLDAGDVVVFGRLRVDFDRIFIGFRRRMADPTANPLVVPPTHPGPRVYYPANTHGAYPALSTPPYQPHCLHPGTVVRSQTKPRSENSKILRLFGVDVEYQLMPAHNDVSNKTFSYGASSELSQGQVEYQQYFTSNDII